METINYGLIESCTTTIKHPCDGRRVYGKEIKNSMRADDEKVEKQERVSLFFLVRGRDT